MFPGPDFVETSAVALPQEKRRQEAFSMPCCEGRVGVGGGRGSRGVAQRTDLPVGSTVFLCVVTN